MSKTIWFDDARPNDVVKAYSEKQINKIKADAVRDAAREINWMALTKPIQAKDALNYISDKIEKGGAE